MERYDWWCGKKWHLDKEDYEDCSCYATKAKVMFPASGASDPGDQPPPVPVPTKIKSDGSSTDYYNIPHGAKDLNDLILYKKMNFGTGNIFKACYRLGEKHDTDREYDLNKIIYFATSELKYLKEMN